MITPSFDSNQRDELTFAPFVLEDCRDTESQDVRLSFFNWDWLQQKYGSDSVDDYYLNGYGVEGLVKATRLLNNLEPEPDFIEFNSEGDTCYIHFTNFEEALKTAELCAAMMADISSLKRAIAAAREHGFEDG